MDATKLSSLTEAELSALLGTSRRMIRKYLKEKGLPYRGDGRSRRFAWSAVMDWYVAYRLDIALMGGRQSGNGGKLSERVVRIQNEAEEKGRIDARTIASRDCRISRSVILLTGWRIGPPL